ncbi:MAG: site-specific integrase [Acidobacteria bacterium]|nr:MAG: site-specific integrase [Acidobacteriota bacterium]
MVGWVRDLRTEKAARERLTNLHINLNLDVSENAPPPACFAELIEHYRRKELAGTNNERKAYSTKLGYEAYLVNWIVPRWGEYPLGRMENGIAVHVEEWLATLQRSRGTKAKIRNIMSAVCSHAIRYGWMKANPIRAVRQSAKRESIPTPLTAEELQALFAELGPRERTLVLLDVPTGMRRGELLATQWCDIDFQKMTLNIRKSIWQQHLGPVKTEESEKTMPLDEEVIADLLRWRSETPYAHDEDWIFASPRMNGRQPLWPEALMRNHIAPAALRAGITKHLNWHVFRHTFSTLLAENDEDVKTVQSLMRHANSAITMDIYTHAVSSKKRREQSKVVEMILPRERKESFLTIAQGTA